MRVLPSAATCVPHFAAIQLQGFTPQSPSGGKMRGRGQLPHSCLTSCPAQLCRRRKNFFESPGNGELQLWGRLVHGGGEQSCAWGNTMLPLCTHSDQQQAFQHGKPITHRECSFRGTSLRAQHKQWALAAATLPQHCAITKHGDKWVGVPPASAVGWDRNDFCATASACSMCAKVWSQLHRPRNPAQGQGWTLPCTTATCRHCPSGSPRPGRKDGWRSCFLHKETFTWIQTINE